MSDLAQRVAAVFNPENPLAEAYARGLVVDRKMMKRTSTVNLGDVSETTTTFEVTQTWPLERGTGIVANFIEESFRHRLAKLFSTEIHTGDAAFDTGVYVTTDTWEATKALLESESARDAIRALIEDGCTVSIEDDRLVINGASSDETTADPGPRELGLLLTHLILLGDARR